MVMTRATCNGRIPHSLGPFTSRLLTRALRALGARLAPPRPPLALRTAGPGISAAAFSTERMERHIHAALADAALPSVEEKVRFLRSTALNCPAEHAEEVAVAIRRVERALGLAGLVASNVAPFA